MPILAEIPIRFDQPMWLLLLLLLVPAFLMSRRSIGGLSRTKAWLTFSLRSIVIALLAVALAQPSLEKRGEGLTVTVLLDRSQSIPAPLKRSSLEFLQRATEFKERTEDRVAVITVAKDANITAMADRYSAVDVNAEEGDLTATNLEGGVEIALAIMPDDTANRIVLASDGNETIGTVLAAADRAKANGVPIDVLVLEYEYDNEVIFEELVAPARAREGQTAKLRMVLRSQAEATGVIRLKVNDSYFDLNGMEPGDGMRVELGPGTTAFEQIIGLDQSGPHEFEAVFVPDDPSMDAIDRNNRAIAVTFVGGQGKVLVVDDGVTQSQYLVTALEESGITVDLRSPDALVGGLVFLSGYDTVVLVNIPRWAFDQTQDRMLHAYVHDLGGGLVMTGGPQAFGAGGWIDTELAKALPIRLNPPDTRQMPAGALALIMHSCEMAQGNFWGQKVAQSAIEALSRLDYAGIVEFNWGAPGGIQGCSWAFPMQRLGDKQSAIQSTKTMTVGDMPAFGPSMELALAGLISVNAAQRHAIIISDGDPQPPSGKLLQKYIDNSVTVTTVMVGGHGTGVDRNRMRAVANKTGGQFYDVKNPKSLPQIFIKEARIVSRSLIQDGNVYPAAVVSQLPGPVRGFSQLPAVDGYVLTAPREGLAQVPIVIPTKEGNDPLFANWNYGLGRSVAYTSDVASLWGARWASWSQFQAFWEQAVRWSMRPSSPTNLQVNTRFEGDIAFVEVEAYEADASFLNFLSASGIVLRPDAEAEAITLQQTGPGRYVGQFKTDEAGAYLINIGFITGGDGSDRTQGSIQAAVNVPYAREFRTVKHNRAKLEQLARLTGGRMLSAGDPRLANLFDITDLEVPRTYRRVWDLLAILAAVALLLDVAARRIAIQPAELRKTAERLVGKRGDVTTSSVAAWKRTRAQVAHRRPKDAAAAKANRSVKFEADETDRDRAFDVGAETTDSPRPKPGVTPTRATEPDSDETADDYTARLLAAKRRARGEPNDRSEPDA